MGAVPLIFDILMTPTPLSFVPLALVVELLPTVIICVVSVVKDMERSHLVGPLGKLLLSNLSLLFLLPES